MKMFLDIVKTTRDDEAGAYKSGYSHSAPRPGHRKNKTDPKLSKWYTDYQDLERLYEADDTGWEFQSMRNKWRRRFRVPREVFHRLLDICRAKGLGVASGKGRPPHPLELKVMGCLRVLGRSACFDDLEDATFIDEETHRRFFHQFIAIFARGDTFAQWVSTPASQQEIMDVMSLYTLVGLSGCIGSIDCVHIPWGMCPAEDRSWFAQRRVVQRWSTRSLQIALAVFCLSLLVFLARATTKLHAGSIASSPACGMERTNMSSTRCTTSTGKQRCAEAHI
jgi:hypothetical protein